MKRVLAALCAVALTAAAPAAYAERRGYGYGHHGGHYRDYDDDDHGDAVAAGVVGLLLGAVIASAASEQREREREPVYAPPPGPPRDQYGYPIEPGRGGYDPYYNGGGYEGEGECFRRTQQWDSDLSRYVDVMVPIPCP
jgi:opacity protein-like surface antigen